MSEALAVFFTFSTYGTHLHGAVSGSVDRSRRAWGAPLLVPSVRAEMQAKNLMSEPEFTLDQEDRKTVLNSIVAAADHRGWHLWCAHVRSNHAHAVLQPDCESERALAYIKARATFGLRLVMRTESDFGQSMAALVISGAKQTSIRQRIT